MLQVCILMCNLEKIDEIIMPLIISNELVVNLMVYVVLTYITSMHHNQVDVKEQMQGSPFYFVQYFYFFVVFFYYSEW